MSKPLGVVFLFDVDNTLIDNDRVQADLREHLEQTYGGPARDRYWEILEKLRDDLGYVDYLGALERFRIETIHRPDVLRMSSWLVDYPFANRLQPLSPNPAASRSFTVSSGKNLKPAPCVTTSQREKGLDFGC